MSLLRYNNLPGELLTVTQEKESIDYKNFNWDAYASIGHKLWGIHVDYKLGVIHKSQLLSATLSNQNIGANRYSRWTEYIEPRVTYKRGSITLNTVLRGMILQQRLEDQKKNTFALDGRVHVDCDVSPMLTLQSFVTHTNTPQDLETSTTLPLYIAYNAQQIGTGKLESTSTSSIGGGAKYQNPIRGFFANLNASYFLSRNLPIYSASVDHLIYIQRATPMRSNTNGFNMSGRVSQSTGWAMLTVALSGRYNHTNYQLLLGDALKPYVGRSATVGLETHFHPINDLSLELNSSLSYRSVGEKGSEHPTKIRSYLHSLKVYYMPGNWTLSWENSLFHSSDKSVSRNFFSDFSVNYRAERYEIGLLCHNIFGARTYTRRWLSPSMDTSSITNLRGREIMVKGSFSF